MNLISGAHLCGLSAKWLQYSVGKVGTIIGLDPAGPGFSIFDVENRLDYSDADYVLILHTDIRMYGIQRPIGHGLESHFLISFRLIKNGKYFLFSRCLCQRRKATARLSLDA